MYHTLSKMLTGMWYSKPDIICINYLAVIFEKLLSN